MSTISTSDFQKGIYIEYNTEPHQIVDFQFVNPGKGSAFVKTKLKNIKNGRVKEFTFKSGEAVVEISVEVKEMQYLYKSGDDFIFMNQKSFEQTNVSSNIIATFSSFLKEGAIYQILLDKGQAIGIRVPKRVTLAVLESTDAVKGNTATAARKTVTLEGGLKISVPLFIKEGDLVAIDVESGQYLERINKA